MSIMPCRSKYKTARELWAAILKTFGGNEATKKTKKNLLKQQYGNFKAEGLETLEQTFNRLQIDEDDMEEMDIKWNMALLSMRADKFWKKTWKKISIQGSDVAGFDKSKVKCFSCHKMGSKTLIAIDGVGWDWSYMANNEEDHALVADEVAPTEFALMANTSAESKRSDKNKEGLGYSDVPPPPVQLYLSPKKDLSWTGLPECADDTVTDYSRPSPTIESNISYLSDFEPFNGGYVSFGQGGCKITGKGTIKTGKLEFKNVYFVKDLKYNLFSIS
nr:ribonuclease H-like domain-containing protein [Tanacetum cinerariifolium]